MVDHQFKTLVLLLLLKIAKRVCDAPGVVPWGYWPTDQQLEADVEKYIATEGIS